MAALKGPKGPKSTEKEPKRSKKVIFTLKILNEGSEAPRATWSIVLRLKYQIACPAQSSKN